MVTQGVKYSKFDQKITPNIGNMQITSHFGPFDDNKWPQTIFGTTHDSISSK